jgi:hypothetical protein
LSLSNRGFVQFFIRVDYLFGIAEPTHLIHLKWVSLDQ